MARVVSANSRARSEIEYVALRSAARASERRGCGIAMNVRVVRSGRASVPRYHTHEDAHDCVLPLEMTAPILDYPFDAPPAPGDPRDVAPHVAWLRMPLPFALDHIN